MTENATVLTTGDVAGYCGVSRMGVIRWIRDGKLKAYATPGGHYRIRLGDFRDFLEQYDMPVDGSFFEQENGRVLVIADDPSILGVVVKALTAMPEGCDIDVALDGPSAVRKAADFQPELVILDAAGPGTEAGPLRQWLNENAETHHIPILILTASVTEPSDPGQPTPWLSGDRHLIERSPLEIERLQAEVRRLLYATHPTSK